MEHRINYSKIGLKAIKGLQELDNYVESSGLEKSLIELIRLRTSQINACNYCVSLQTEEAMQSGENRDRIDNVSSWRKKDIYSDREKAALAWTEALTLIAQNEISDEFYGEVRGYFDEQELITLTIAINGINSWNRLAISFRTLEKAKEQF
ncbi:carboxymuconolactone decarboxylase family protein [Gillisia sp. Q332]|uniref:carboxymuconolactone decarboxylase family protein n=1 Tax=Gillisia xinjiangensis TaxID=3384765 RepID=UPI00391D84B9